MSEYVFAYVVLIYITGALREQHTRREQRDTNNYNRYSMGRLLFYTRDVYYIYISSTLTYSTRLKDARPRNSYRTVRKVVDYKRYCIGHNTRRYAPG